MSVQMQSGLGVYTQAIDNSAKQIKNRSMSSGQGREICSPLLSVYLGNRDSQIKNIVEEIYNSCWRGANDVLLSLNETDYSPEQAEEMLVKMMLLGERFENRSRNFIAYYWDITGDGFETDMQRLERVPKIAGASTKCYYFIFCSQKTGFEQDRTRERLNQLMEWASEHDRHLMVLSDVMYVNGLLGEDAVNDNFSIKSNYRMAADLMLLVNSVYPSDADMGTSLDFWIEHQKSPIYTGGYWQVGKPVRQIAQVALWQTLEEYLSLSAISSKDGSVKERLCGNNGYWALCESFFQQNIAPMLPADHSFWKYMPRTREIDILSGDIKAKEKPSRGFFGRKKSLDHGNGITPGLLHAAFNSSKPIDGAGIAETCFEQYYLTPVLDWLSSADGQTTSKRYFLSELNSVLRFQEMAQSLPLEIKAIQSISDRDIQFELPDPDPGKGVEEDLHQYACTLLKRNLYRPFMNILCKTMQELSQNTYGFDSILQQVKESLRPSDKDAAIKTRYSEIIHDVVLQNERIKMALMREISPCNSESDLLEQISEFFENYLSIDRAFEEPFFDDTSLFDHKMRDSLRLQFYSTPDMENTRSVCLMNPSTGFSTNELVFDIPRKDRIERLLICPVDPENINYSV